MDDTSGKEPLRNEVSDLNVDLLHAIMELVSDGIWDWNANTGFVYRNPGWYEMLGYSHHSLENSVFTWENVIHPEDYPRVMAGFDDYICQRAPHYRAEYRCRKEDGTYLWIEDRGYVIARNPDGSVARMVGAHRDIHTRKCSIEQLQKRNQSLEALVAERTLELSRVNQQLQLQLDENRSLAERDALTRIANRYRLEKVLLEECDRAERFRLPLALVAMDVDDFKPINDQYGHGVGDEVLRAIGTEIQDAAGATDLPCRLGGDEFALLTQVADHRELTERALRIAESIRQLRFPQSAAQLTVSVSVGGGLCSEDTEWSVWYSEADCALYHVKGSGGDGAHVMS